MHTYLHLMNSVVSRAECRRGHRSCSGVSCVPVFCADIRCLSGPVTVYNIISGDAEEMTMFFHCCHLSTGDASSLLCLMQHRVLTVRACLVSRLLFLLLLREKCLHHVQDLLSPWRQFLKRVSFPPHFLFYILLQWLSCQSPIKHAVFFCFEMNKLLSGIAD